MNRRIFVWLTVSPEKEQDFNHWYEQEYIPRFVTQIPGIEAVSRWRIDGTQTYVTVYDLQPGANFDDVSEAWGSPDRQSDRDGWQLWEDAHLGEVRDGFFSQTFEYRPEAMPGA